MGAPDSANSREEFPESGGLTQIMSPIRQEPLKRSEPGWSGDGRAYRQPVTQRCAAQMVRGRGLHEAGRDETRGHTGCHGPVNPGLIETVAHGDGRFPQTGGPTMLARRPDHAGPTANRGPRPGPRPGHLDFTPTTATPGSSLPLAGTAHKCRCSPNLWVRGRVRCDGR